MVQTSGLAHMTIAVTDTARSLEFYRRHLGMTFLGGSHERGMIFLDAGGDCIILARVDTAPSTARLEDIHHAFIVDHGAYEDAVEAFAEQIEGLKAGGAGVAQMRLGALPSVAARLMPEGLVELETMRLLDPFLTSRGAVFRMQIVGHYDAGGPFTRIEAVIDATGQLPRVTFVRDLTELGKGYSYQLLIPD